jgi:hypothetical protein
MRTLATRVAQLAVGLVAALSLAACGSDPICTTTTIGGTNRFTGRPNIITHCEPKHDIHLPEKP